MSDFMADERQETRFRFWLWLIRSFWKLQQTSPGFQSEQILAAGVSLNKHEYSPARLIQHYQQEMARLRQLPGVEAVAAISQLPLGGLGFCFQPC